MEIVQQGREYVFKNTVGPVPKELQGTFNSLAVARDRLAAFQSAVRSRALNVSERQRRKEYARKNSTSAT